MRDPSIVLAVLRERGKRNLPINRVYRLLYNPELFLRAYGNIYGNPGALTPGSDPNDTVDGMSLRRIEKLIMKLRDGTFEWKPVRRAYIPKRDGGKRPLGVPSWTDKLLQGALKMILEAYYEPQFSSHSHGFSPQRGCHTALAEIHRTFTGTNWFIEGDIKGCFDNIDHQILVNVLARDIHDNRFVHLIAKLLKTGYMEEW
ncbi:MAG: maturase, partial [Anaerolineales bacterium]